MPQSIPRVIWAIMVAFFLAWPARGDVVYILNVDEEALEARLVLIESAECEIDAAYYAIDGGEVARKILSALCDAADRGVKVRLLVDGLKDKIPGDVRRALIAHGIAFREFHPLGKGRPDWLNNRMHDKLLVADRRHMIVGSRNLEDHHFGLAKLNYVDRDVFVCGCSALEAHEYFMGRWNGDDIRTARLMPRPIDAVKSHLQATGKRTQPHRCCDCTPLYCEDGVELCFCCVPVCFLYDPPELPKRTRQGIERDVLELLDSAKCEIIIETPYLVLSRETMRILLNARQRGVAVRILTNSVASTDEKLSQAAYENDKRKLLNAGIELAEYAGPEHLHAKSAVVDGQYALIGSFNFDARSESANSEIGVLIHNRCQAAILADSIFDDARNAFEIGPDGRPLGSQVRHPNAKLGKESQIRAARLVVPFIRRLL